MSDPLSLALGAARDAARDAGDAILAFYGRPLTVDVKTDDSPLTQADLAAHGAIAKRLADSGVPLLSEEGDPESADRRGWDRFWCVDPLDGTKEFVKGSTTDGEASGEFTVNVALVEGGAPVLGVVHVPVLGVTYYAAGGGAWKQTGEAEPVSISTRPAPDGALTVVASRDHAGPEVAAMLGRVETDGRRVEVASMGSSLKFCLVAEGAADFYPRTAPTFEWDTAAAQTVLEAAGGGVSTRDGSRLRYNKADLRNPSVFAWGDPDLEWASWVPSRARS